MKRTFAIILAAVAVAALFAGLVHAVLVAAHLAEPAGTTVYGLTLRRLWATLSALLALLGVGTGGLALARPDGLGPAPGRHMAIAALVAGLVAAVNGGLNLAIATGGPGTGNGVVGAAAAVVLGAVALGMGGRGLARHRPPAFERGGGTWNHSGQRLARRGKARRHPGGAGLRRCRRCGGRHRRTPSRAPRRRGRAPRRGRLRGGGASAGGSSPAPRGITG